MAPKGATSTYAYPQSFVTRVTGAMAGAIKGASDAWFGPLQPIGPQAPEEVRGRAFDYSTGRNLPILPRTEPGDSYISHATLRALADPNLGGYDLVRLAVETRKDQMANERWVIREREGKGKKKGDGGQRARDIEQALRRPDRILTFRTWQRKLIEDMLVIDAATIYLRPSVKGYKVPEVMDGALIKPLIDDSGRPPLAPEPSYQQVIKGVAACTYTTDELIYAPRNLRSDRMYGFSPVEQIVLTINIALRRQVSQLEYYTSGSVPDMLASVPENWSTKQIGEFQGYWDAILSGELAERRKLRFIPGGMKPYECKPGQLKDEYDEWLARIVCYAFSLSPQAFTKQMNRATAETAQQSAASEGLEPLKLWWSDVMDEVLEKAFDAPDLEYAYSDEEINDPLIKAQVLQIAVGKPWMTAAEAREQYGMEPNEALDEPPEPPPQLAAPADKPEQLPLPIDGAKPGDEAKKLRKSLTAGRSLQGDQPKPHRHSPSCGSHTIRYP